MDDLDEASAYLLLQTREGTAHDVAAHLRMCGIGDPAVVRGPFDIIVRTASPGAAAELAALASEHEDVVRALPCFPARVTARRPDPLEPLHVKTPLGARNEVDGVRV